jgi:hypothetical protein
MTEHNSIRDEVVEPTPEILDVPSDHSAKEISESFDEFRFRFAKQNTQSREVTAQRQHFDCKVV